MEKIEFGPTEKHRYAHRKISESVPELVALLKTFGYKVKSSDKMYQIYINGIEFQVNSMRNGLMLITGSLLGEECIRFIYGSKSQKWVNKQKARLDDMIRWENIRFQYDCKAAGFKEWANEVILPVIEQFQKVNGNCSIDSGTHGSESVNYLCGHPINRYLLGVGFTVMYSTHQSNAGVHISVKMDRQTVPISDLRHYSNEVNKLNALLVGLQNDIEAAIEAGDPAPIFS